jgi:hypothetical protein
VRLPDPLDLRCECFFAAVGGVGLLEDIVEQASVDDDRVIRMARPTRVSELAPQLAAAAAGDCVRPRLLDRTLLELSTHRLTAVSGEIATDCPRLIIQTTETLQSAARRSGHSGRSDAVSRSFLDRLSSTYLAEYVSASMSSSMRTRRAFTPPAAPLA